MSTKLAFVACINFQICFQINIIVFKYKFSNIFANEYRSFQYFYLYTHFAHRYTVYEVPHPNHNSRTSSDATTYGENSSSNRTTNEENNSSNSTTNVLDATEASSQTDNFSKNTSSQHIPDEISLKKYNLVKERLKHFKEIEDQPLSASDLRFIQSIAVDACFFHLSLRLREYFRGSYKLQINN